MPTTAKVQIKAGKDSQESVARQLRQSTAITMGETGTHNRRVMLSHNAAGSCESESVKRVD